jgi:hypothetical protein
LSRFDFLGTIIYFWATLLSASEETQSEAMATTSTKRLVEADDHHHPGRSWAHGRDEAYLNPKEAAATLHVSKSYLDKLRVYGGGPTFLRFGRKILYRKADLDLWAAERCFSSTRDRMGIASGLLQHTDKRTTERHYNKGATLSTVRRYQRFVDELMSD